MESFFAGLERIFVMPPHKRFNYLAILVFLVLVISFAVGMSLLIKYLGVMLKDFIINYLEIREFYVGKIIIFLFLVCSSFLLIILLMLDGEDKRLRAALSRCFRKLVVEDYYDRKDPASPGEVVPDAEETLVSARVAASVRPKAPMIEEEYKEGLVDGTFKELFENGSLSREVRYISGKKNGLFRTYYENGQLEQEAVYRDDNINGTYRAYYEDGSVHQEKEYDHGKLNGVYKAFDEKGMMFFEISYRDDIQHGTDKVYDQHGVIQFVDTYENGFRVNRKTYNEYGVLKFDQSFERDAAVVGAEGGEENISEREARAKEKRRQRRGGLSRHSE